MATATARRTASASSTSTGNGNGHSGRNRISNVPGRNGNGSGKSNGGKRGAGGNGNGHGKAGGPARLTDAELELRLQRWEKLKADAKELYSAADLLESEIITQLGPSGSVTLSDSRVLRVKNNFVDAAGVVKVKAFGLAGVRLYEISCK